jgi:YVTN family beta-propeller protein
VRTSALALLVMGLGGAPAAADRLIVLNKSDDRAAIIDPASLETRGLVTTGEGPHEVAVSPDGRTAWVTNYGLSAVFRDGAQRRNLPGRTITVIDLATATVRDSFDLGTLERPHGIQVSRDGSRLWVTCEGAQTVAMLDARSGAILKRWRTDQEISHMLVATPDERKLYVANIGSGSVTVIEVETDRVQSLVTGAGAEGIDVTPDGREVWVTNRSDNTIAVIDVAEDEVAARFPSGGQMPIRIKFTPDGQKALVSNARSNTVAVFDRAARKRTGLIKVGAMPVGIQLTPDGRHAFVACTNDDQVKRLDLERRRVDRSFSPGNEPDGMAWARRD